MLILSHSHGLVGHLNRTDVVNGISIICAFPAMKSQNVCSEADTTASQSREKHS